MWGKFQKQNVLTIWVKGTTVSVLKTYIPCMGEKLVLENFTNGLSTFERVLFFSFLRITLTMMPSTVKEREEKESNIKQIY